jgi:large subunit ribosomal protein L18e
MRTQKSSRISKNQGFFGPAKLCFADFCCPQIFHWNKKMKSGQKNEQLMELLQLLKKTAIENDAAIWKRVASDLEGPTRRRRVVNVYKLDKYTKDNETVVVPGKVLGTGELNKKLTVAAYTFSGQALEKINAKGKALSIKELVEKNPKGSKVRIMG